MATATVKMSLHLSNQTNAAAMMLGASAVQMGTAFLTCKESSASVLHKQLILQKSAEETCVTNVFTGKQVRCLKNQFVIKTESLF